MLEIQGIDHIVLRVMNIDKMLLFYCDILGCTIEKTQKDIGLTHLRIGNNLIDLFQVNNPPQEPGYNLEHICLRVIDFNYEYLRKYFLENGCEIYNYGNRYGSQGYGESFYLKDPEGNEIELVALK